MDVNGPASLLFPPTYFHMLPASRYLTLRRGRGSENREKWDIDVCKVNTIEETWVLIITVPWLGKHWTRNQTRKMYLQNHGLHNSSAET